MHHQFQVQCGNAACSRADASSTKVTGYVFDPIGNRVDEPDLIADNRYPAYNDPLRAVFQPGRFRTTYGSFGQRRGNSNFKVSFQNHRDEGTVARLHGYSRQNFRINADQALTENFDASVGAFYARSRADEPEGFPNRVFFDVRTTEPDLKIDSVAVDCPPTIPDCTWKGSLSPAFLNRGRNPLYALEQENVTRARARFTGTFSARYRPLTWLTGEASLGYDQSNEEQQAFTPYGFVFSDFTTGKGRLSHRTSGDRAYNANLTLTSSRNLTGSIRNTSKAAFVYEDQTHDFASIDAAQLLVPYVNKLTAADPSQLTTSSRSETIRASNSYFVTTFEIKNRYILDGLARQDRSSLFGSSERSQIYYRASAAWRVTEDFHVPLLDELKLRASHGTAGLRPPFVAQYAVFTIVGGTPEKLTAGNPQLRPAFSRETEYGFNLSAFRNYSVEYNYSTKTTTDQILNVPLSSTTGYVSQWQNVGTLAGSTHEAVFGAVLLSKAHYLWRVNVTADRTRQRVTELKSTPFDIAGQLRIAPGETYGALYGSRMIRTLAELKETLKTGQLSGEEADYVVNEDGFYVRRSQYRTRAEVPLLYWTCGAGDSTCAYARATTKVRLGDVSPDLNMGFNTLAQWKSLSASATLVWAKGGHIYNNTRRAALQRNSFTDALFDQSGKPDPGSCPALADDPLCPYKTGRKPSTYYTAFLSSDAFFFETASYVKLRELAVNWELPKRLVARMPVGDIRTARLGIVGRNLWTKTRYTGYDPDVAVDPAGTPFLNRRDNWSYPPYRTFTAMLELGF